MISYMLKTSDESNQLKYFNIKIFFIFNFYLLETISITVNTTGSV